MTARPLSGMPMDAYRVGDNFVAHFDLPGVDPGSIDLSVEGNILTVTAERSVPQLENAEWSIAERPFGSYSRQLVLGRVPRHRAARGQLPRRRADPEHPRRREGQGPQDPGHPRGRPRGAPDHRGRAVRAEGRHQLIGRRSTGPGPHGPGPSAFPTGGDRDDDDDDPWAGSTTPTSPR